MFSPEACVGLSINTVKYMPAALAIAAINKDTEIQDQLV